MATAIPRPTRPVANDASPPSLPALPVARTRQSSRTTTALLPALSTPSPRLPERSLSRTVANPAALDDTPGGGVPLPAPSSILKPNTSPVIAPGKWLSKSNALSSPQSSIGSVRRTTSARSSLTPRTSVRAPSYTTAPRAMSQSASPSNGASSGSATPSPQPIGGTRTASDESSTPTLESMQDEHAINEIAELEAPADLSTACDPAPLAVNSASQEKGNVIVSVRVRPELGGPKYRGGGSEWWIDGEEATISYRGRESGEYTYDNVFTPEDQNAKVYEACTKRLVRRVMEGYHGTVFAYGMTGSGKTFSMQGTASSPGVIPLAITDIFSFIRETPQREFLLRVSYLEIYNERIYDLLSAQNGLGQAGQSEEIKLREDPRRGVYAAPLKEEIVQSPTQLLRVIHRGDMARRTANTQYNARSSRSHAVVQVVVESRERQSSSVLATSRKRSAIAPGGVRVSTLSLIDLAGSERGAENKEQRFEGAHINKSLLTLGTVISRLSSRRDKDGNSTDSDGKHLPYRDSKLTRLLQSALSGKSLVSILCTMHTGVINNSAGAGTHIAETLNTLKFAARARNNIVSYAKRAEEAYSTAGDAGSRALLDRYRLEIANLRKELEVQKREQLRSTALEEDLAREQEAEQRHEQQMLEMQLARTALKERIDHLNHLILSSKSVGVNVDNKDKMDVRKLRRKASTETFDLSRYAMDEPSEEEDFFGDDGDGNASLDTQVRLLQTDLASKTRYISTLEQRLLQARKYAVNRNAAMLSSKAGYSATDAAIVIRDKDIEIIELRQRLEDKEYMIVALKSAAKKRDAADMSQATTNGRRVVTEPMSFHRAMSTVTPPATRPDDNSTVTPRASLHQADPNATVYFRSRTSAQTLDRNNTTALSSAENAQPIPTSVPLSSPLMQHNRTLNILEGEPGRPCTPTENLRPFPLRARPKGLDIGIPVRSPDGSTTSPRAPPPRLNTWERSVIRRSKSLESALARHGGGTGAGAVSDKPAATDSPAMAERLAGWRPRLLAARREAEAQALTPANGSGSMDGTKSPSLVHQEEVMERARQHLRLESANSVAGKQEQRAAA